MIDLHELTFEYPDGTEVFKGLNWQVERGDSWAVIGPSGCGKTTLLYLLAGLLHSTSGQVTVAGQPLDRPRPRTGLILQDFGLLPWATVEENASLGLRVRTFYGPDGRHAPRDESVANVSSIVEPWLQRLGVAHLKDQYPAQLSGGQRQRTAIARTLALNPDLLLMDEPFASLDAPTRENLQALILQLREERQMTLLLVTHTIEEAALVGNKILLLQSPPMEHIDIVENHGGGAASFRDTPAYNKTCLRLRRALEPVG